MLTFFSKKVSSDSRNYLQFIVITVITMSLAFGFNKETNSPVKEDSLFPAAKEIVTFPADFKFGTAIAGFQADSGCPTLPAKECEDHNSDWAAFVKNPEIIADPKMSVKGDPLSTGPGNFELYKEDFDRARNELGNDSFRLSMEWSRIFPTSTVGVNGYDDLKKIANPKAIEHYHAVFAAMRERGLTPFVTLNHYTLPLWIHDGIGCHKNLATCKAKGWLDKNTSTEIAKYAGFVAHEFGDQVDFWITENEPQSVALTSFLFLTKDRINPPALDFHFTEFKTSLENMIKAHAQMYDAIKQNDHVDADKNGTDSEVGLVFAITPVIPMNPVSRLDKKGAENLFYLYNTSFLNAITKGDVDFDLDGNTEHLKELSGKMDFLGINYYYALKVKGTSGAQISQLSRLSTFNIISWFTPDGFRKAMLIDPKGIYDSIMIVKKLGIPIYITENGTVIPEDGKDLTDYASSFLVQHLSWVSQAIKDGADVRGYFYWTFMDNYEWNRGMNDIRMGLYEVNKNDPLKTRKKRKVADTYAEIVRKKSINPELQKEFGTRNLN